MNTRLDLAGASTDNNKPWQTDYTESQGIIFDNLFDDVIYLKDITYLTTFP